MLVQTALWTAYPKSVPNEYNLYLSKNFCNRTAECVKLFRYHSTAGEVCVFLGSLSRK